VTENSYTLRESPTVGSELEKGFKGELKDGKLTGNWIEKSRDKSYAFSLSVDSQFKPEIPGELDNITGKYISERNSDSFRGSASIKFIADNIFYFEINTAIPGGCIGDIQNLIELKNFQIGTFSDKLCEELSLDIKSGRLVVTQSFKCLYHGFKGCEFQGTNLKE
jgi:hypothetical protein